MEPLVLNRTISSMCWSSHRPSLIERGAHLHLSSCSGLYFCLTWWMAVQVWQWFISRRVPNKFRKIYFRKYHFKGFNYIMQCTCDKNQTINCKNTQKCVYQKTLEKHLNDQHDHKFAENPDWYSCILASKILLVIVKSSAIGSCVFALWNL